MVSVSKIIYGWFNSDNLGEWIVGYAILFFVGVILYISMLYDADMGWINPYKTIIIWLVPILSIIMTEWIYIDSCINSSKENWNGYFPEKLLSILVGISLTLSGLMGITLLIGILIAIVYVIISFIKWIGANTHTTIIALIVIICVILYFVINTLVGKYVRKRK